jgi:hypothetical protein
MIRWCQRCSHRWRPRWKQQRANSIVINGIGGVKDENVWTYADHRPIACTHKRNEEIQTHQCVCLTTLEGIACKLLTMNDLV